MSNADWAEIEADTSAWLERLEKNRTRAGELLAEKGLTIHQATDILFSRIAESGVVPEILLTPEDEYDAWFRAKVQEALDDPRPLIPGEEVEAYFAMKRAALSARIANGEK
ncbi:MAG: type II toxin-antitoxin system RelB/DinJ family antitoxin [Devosia sp.]|uniref:antitoxin PaaA2 family protein n=1 Tax=Devosia sp. TaxID=1871048 RepID=UPI001AC83179|nr:type II toxin-antitoxin system RelB/DinJ family antitoxin [Devosia sp.]MBN9310317.1 type II toxin-antitoxin system RelB/DinJ family antitoxin [Devosia sp.]MBN9316907.1 type II toxin-antitoxin system RelB/DinJ family antitoxin [Devosia sp.]